MNVPKQLDLTFSNLRKVKGSVFRFNLTHNADALVQEGSIPPTTLLKNLFLNVYPICLPLFSERLTTRIVPCIV